jgi:hypothetical protein
MQADATPYGIGHGNKLQAGVVLFPYFTTFSSKQEDAWSRFVVRLPKQILPGGSSAMSRKEPQHYLISLPALHSEPSPAA